MLKFKQFLNETFVNAIGDESKDVKSKYAKQVWDILQRSYADIGGIHGSGFKSQQDMVDNIPFWKMAIVNGKVVAVTMYKTKGDIGRKSVAIGTDGSDAGKKQVVSMLKADFRVSFGEKSGSALGALMKNTPWSVLEAFTLKPADASKALRKPLTPLADFDGEIDKDAVRTFAKYPQLKDYAYVRNIGGEPHVKVAFGTPGIKIT